MASSALSVTLYSVTSFTLTLLVVLYAYATRIRFYPVVVFLFTSKFALVSMVNSGMVLGFLFSLGCVRLFLGKLREAETESLWDHLRYTIMESAFALTTFREELNVRVAVLFSIMLFTKLFQMLLAGRVEHIEQQSNPNLPRTVHARLFALTGFLLVCNAAMLAGSGWHLTRYGPNVYLLFAFEHALLLCHLFSQVGKYGILLYDLHVVEGRWANKSAVEMYCALTSEAAQFAFCLVYTCLIWTHYGIPIHTLRSLYYTAKNLADRVTHFVRYRRILHTLNERFPTATEEELAATDGVCIICREEMFIAEADNMGLGVPKKLQCNHLFHAHCLQTWLERQFSCPTCRRPIPVGLPPQQHPLAAQAQAQAPPAAAAQQPVVVAEEEEEVRPAAARHSGSNSSSKEEEEEEGGDDEEEETGAHASSSSSTTTARRQLPGSPRVAAPDHSDAALLRELSPLFPPPTPTSTTGAVTTATTGAGAATAASYEQRRQLLELELRVFEAQSAVAKQVYELSKALLVHHHHHHD